MTDVKRSTVDELTRRGVNTGMDAAEAKEVAVDSAERVNAARQEEKPIEKRMHIDDLCVGMPCTIVEPADLELELADKTPATIVNIYYDTQGRAVGVVVRNEVDSSMRRFGRLNRKTGWSLVNPRMNARLFIGARMESARTIFRGRLL